MNSVEKGPARSFAPAEALRRRRDGAGRLHGPGLEEKKNTLAQDEGRLDLRHTDSLASIGVAFLESRHRQRKIGVNGIGVIAPQIAIEAGGALDRSCRALIEGDAAEPLCSAEDGLRTLAATRAVLAAAA